MSRRRRRSRAGAWVLVVVAILAAAGAYFARTGQAGSAGTDAQASPAASPQAAPASAGSWQLVQEPSAGMAGIRQLITGAKRSIDMTMYELQDTQTVDELTAAAQRGVTVRVILDAAYSGKSANADAYTQLEHGGVAVKWGPASTIVHQKTITVDAGQAGAASAIGTANLQQQYYASTLDAWVIDRDQAQVDAIEATFASDWAAMPGQLGQAQNAAGLLWSPGAQSALASVIASAKTRVQFSSEELSDEAVIQALEGRAKAGVACQVLMTQQSEYAAAMRQLEAAGCSVHAYPDSSSALYVHEKQVIVDNDELLIGSQNASVASLSYDREMSVLVTSQSAPAVVSEAESAYTSAFNGAPTAQ
ncbi:phosphatidylserine/phosphatidylglycerophosphate/cardiolipin synthase family protein [Gryllotalpicola reticulitermitis]|uniref:phospholipase D n=1 Tax=Gryllotalpicola reticulitermitis TaxID=1184153 RepID=A0ABV8Q9L3_9MICO